MRVEGNEILISFDFGDDEVVVPGQPLDMGADDLKAFATMLEDNANRAYQEGLTGTSTSVSKVKIAITGYEDISDNGDWSQVKFVYTFEMDLTTGGGGDSDPTIKEIVRLPLMGADDRDAFTENLVANAGGGGPFAKATSISGTTVTKKGLPTRQPTNAPSISVAPSSIPSESPSW